MSAKRLTFSNFSWYNYFRSQRDLRTVGNMKPIELLDEAFGEMTRLRHEVHQSRFGSADHAAIDKHIANVVTYLDLMVTNWSGSLCEIVAKEFNDESDRIGSDIKIPVHQ